MIPMILYFFVFATMDKEISQLIGSGFTVSIHSFFFFFFFFFLVYI
jgi:hypothetical protein